MIFQATPIKGAYIVDIVPKRDERGFFARVACENEFNAVSLSSAFKQCNMQYNPRRSTLRGMHFQRGPYAEEKLVRCTKGAIYDVIADITPGSPTYRKWFGVELNEWNRRMIYVPKGIAHGYITLSDNTETFYMVTEFYVPEYECGIRFDDPAFGIVWPDVGTLIISDKDRMWPLLLVPELSL